MRHRRRPFTIALVVGIAWGAAAPGPAAAGPDAAPVNAWATGGAPTTKSATPTAVPYWTAPALPTAVIQGGTIPPGWQPQPVPYQGVGPDGQVITQYFAPTYTFTYQVGPPVLAVPQAPVVNRRQAPVYRSPQLYGTAPAPYAAGWGYQQPQAMPPPPAPAVVRYAPPPPIAQPPAGWMPSSAAPPPTIAAQPSAAWGAAALPAAGVAAAAVAHPPASSTPAPANVAMQPVAPPPATVPVAQHRSALWRVVGVQDGDTVTCLDELNQQRKVGLADIDAPEIGQDYGKTSREALAGMVFGRTVEAVDAGVVAGVPTARLYCDGADISRQMIATGSAWQDQASRDSALATEQAQARAAKLGLWASPAPTEPWDYRSQGGQ